LACQASDCYSFGIETFQGLAFEQGVGARKRIESTQHALKLNSTSTPIDHTFLLAYFFSVSNTHLRLWNQRQRSRL